MTAGRTCPQESLTLIGIHVDHAFSGRCFVLRAALISSTAVVYYSYIVGSSTILPYYYQRDRWHDRYGPRMWPHRKIHVDIVFSRPPLSSCRL